MIAGGKTMLLQAGFSQIAAALADPAREAIVAALADGRALPAGELAAAAGISPQSASAHLQQLVDCGFLAVWKQGRFRYISYPANPRRRSSRRSPILRIGLRRDRRAAALHHLSFATAAAATIIWPALSASSSPLSLSVATMSGRNATRPC